MYKPFLAHLQNELFRRFDLQARPIPAGLAHCTSDRGRSPVTIQSWCYHCPELRKIRYTYMDGGEALQVFNCVIYPNHQYDLPFLGIDLLSFSNVKNLVVLDFQPLYQDDAYQAKYIAPLQSLHEKYRDLVQGLEMKSYDANQYFSKYLLFAKVESEVIHKRVFSAFRDYLDSYCQLINLAIPLSRPYEIQRVINAQKKYDQYNAAHDPAHGLFSSHFGSDWATRFLYEFLFEEAKSVVTV